MTDGHSVPPVENIQGVSVRTNPLRRGLNGLLQDIVFAARAGVNADIRLIKRWGLCDAKWHSTQYVEAKTFGLPALGRYLEVGRRKDPFPGSYFEANGWQMETCHATRHPNPADRHFPAVLRGRVDRAPPRVGNL